jgi:hypothetical protein
MGHRCHHGHPIVKTLRYGFANQTRQIGHNTVQGRGRVFAPAANRAETCEKPNSTTDLVYGCNGRACDRPDGAILMQLSVKRESILVALEQRNSRSSLNTKSSVG